ncbi:MAG: hypothetical protein KJ559_02725 [Nanoarchaeota archaeon]|nr:hypothetical protein [Nanoarchaeota archaeon]
MKIKNKKGALSIEWVIMIIILILGFGILLFFLLRFNFGERVNRDVCHESAVLRATLPSIAGNYVPLKCKTIKFCITNGLIGGKCNGRGEDFAGESDITKVKVKTKEDIERFLAQEMLECWQMMGEGKLSLFSQFIVETYGIGGKVYPTCLICSRIAFDKKNLEEAKIDLSQVDVLNYMQTHKPHGFDMSYIDYFRKEKGKFNIDRRNIPVFNDEGKIREVSIIQVPQDEQTSDIYSKQMSVLFMQISAPDHLGSAGNILKTALGGTAGSFVLAPIITTKLTGSFIKTILGHPIISAAFVLIAGTYQQGSVAYNRAVTAGYCGDVSTGGDARGGCSVVRTLNYDVDEIIKYCQVIESIP